MVVYLLAFGAGIWAANLPDPSWPFLMTLAVMLSVAGIYLSDCLRKRSNVQWKLAAMIGLWFVAGLLIVGALVLTRIPMSQREDAAAAPGLAAQKGH